MNAIGGNVESTKVKTVENSIALPQKVEHRTLPFDPAIQPLRMCAKELKTGTQACICMPLFIAALFISFC